MDANQNCKKFQQLDLDSQLLISNLIHLIVLKKQKYSLKIHWVTIWKMNGIIPFSTVFICFWIAPLSNVLSMRIKYLLGITGKLSDDIVTPWTPVGAIIVLGRIEYFS